jgi:nucleotide-binding universal stress UspA family protein
MEINTSERSHYGIDSNVERRSFEVAAGKRKCFAREVTMQKVEMILVPIDFSVESGAALRDAVSLVRETKATLIALHVIDVRGESDFLLSCIAPIEGFPLHLNDSRNFPLDILRRERTLDLWNFVEQTVGSANRNRITKLIRMGSLAKEIAAVIREEHVDLLVFNLRKRFVLPDMAALRLLKIARRLSCPVLIGPPAAGNANWPRARRFELKMAPDGNMA